MTKYLKYAVSNEKRATVFGYFADEPERFGIAEFEENGKVVSLEENPKNHKFTFCVTVSIIMIPVYEI